MKALTSRFALALASLDGVGFGGRLFRFLRKHGILRIRDDFLVRWRVGLLLLAWTAAGTVEVIVRARLQFVRILGSSFFKYPIFCTLSHFLGAVEFRRGSFRNLFPYNYTFANLGDCRNCGIENFDKNSVFLVDVAVEWKKQISWRFALHDGD